MGCFSRLCFWARHVWENLTFWVIWMLLKWVPRTELLMQQGNLTLMSEPRCLICWLNILMLWNSSKHWIMFQWERERTHRSVTIKLPNFIDLIPADRWIMTNQSQLVSGRNWQNSSYLNVFDNSTMLGARQFFLFSPFRCWKVKLRLGLVDMIHAPNRPSQADQWQVRAAPVAAVRALFGRGLTDGRRGKWWTTTVGLWGWESPASDFNMFSLKNFATTTTTRRRRRSRTTRIMTTTATCQA